MMSENYAKHLCGRATSFRFYFVCRGDKVAVDLFFDESGLVSSESQSKNLVGLSLSEVQGMVGDKGISICY